MLAGRLALRRIMEEAEDRIAIPDSVREIIFAEPEITGDGAEDLQPGLVKGRIKLLERVPEARHFRRPDILRHVSPEPVAFGQVAADVPEFLEVVRLLALGGLDPERRVAAGAALSLKEIFA